MLNIQENGAHIHFKAPIRQTTGAVKYDEAQSLTDAQKAQARANINSADMYNGYSPYECVFKPWFSGQPDTIETMWIKGEFHPVDYKTASEEVANAWAGFELIVTSWSGTIAVAKTKAKTFAPLLTNGVFGEDFFEKDSAIEIVDNPQQPKQHVTIYPSGSNRGFIMDTERYANGFRSQICYYIDTDTYQDSGSFYLSYLQPMAYDYTKKPSVSQFLMQSAPTDDMNVATKKYVDDAIATALAQK